MTMSTLCQHPEETHGNGTTCLNMELFEINESVDCAEQQRERDDGDTMDVVLDGAAENIVEDDLFVESNVDHSNVGPFVIGEEPLDDVELRNIIAALGEDVGDLEQFLVSQIQLIRTVSRNGADEVGNLNFRPRRLCHVCFDTVHLHLRPCCRLAVCDPCIHAYVEMQLLSNGNVRIGCPNPDCRSPVYHDEIRLVLASNPELRDRYDRWIVDLNEDPGRKTCPRCCRVTDLDDAMQAVSVSTLSLTSQPTVAVPSEASDRKSTILKNGLKVKCVECQLDWCFSCQAPWHDGLTCKQYRTGDVLLKNWARERLRPGERNAQRCPNCKVCDFLVECFVLFVLYWQFGIITSYLMAVQKLYCCV